MCLLKNNFFIGTVGMLLLANSGCGNLRPRLDEASIADLRDRCMDNIEALRHGKVDAQGFDGSENGCKMLAVIEKIFNDKVEEYCITKVEIKRIMGVPDGYSDEELLYFINSDEKSEGYVLMFWFQDGEKLSGVKAGYFDE